MPFRSRTRFARKPRRRFVKRRNSYKLRRVHGVRKGSTKYFIHNFRRQTVLYGTNAVIGSMIATSVGPGGGYASIAFQNLLSQLPQSNEWTVLYDYYKINYVVLRVIWNGTNISPIEAHVTQVSPPVLYWVIDRDDNNAYAASDAGLQDIRANGMCRRHVFTSDRRECVIKFKPNTLVQNYVSAVSTGYNIQFNKWMDCAQDIPYYGTKMIFHTPSPTGLPGYPNTFEITATYYCSFKQPR